MQSVTYPENFTTWRQLARSLLLAGIPPNEVIWPVSYTHLTLPTTPYV